LAAQNIEANSVILGTEVTSTGGENPSVTIYYGLSDGGTNTGGWQASVTPDGSPGTDDSVSLDDWLTIHGLSPGDELSDLDSDGSLGFARLKIVPTP
jgi:hypothetical protein